ncbi:MAG: hypothetical protein V2I34_00905 [Bacteroidales bacterium]|jgi:hypothetical protein|nr:hypothetical protein [Bacteroidales bacterium]
MKLRITLLIIGTLLLGFAIGMLTSAQLRHKRMRPVRTFASEHYFREHLYRVIEPDSVQKAELDSIIDRYGDEFNEMNAEFWNGFESLMDRQWDEIKEILSREQLNKLEEFDRNRREMMKKFRSRSGSDDSTRFDRRRGPDRDRYDGERRFDSTRYEGERRFDRDRYDGERRFDSTRRPGR